MAKCIKRRDSTGEIGAEDCVRDNLRVQKHRLWWLLEARHWTIEFVYVRGSNGGM